MSFSLSRMTSFAMVAMMAATLAHQQAFACFLWPPFNLPNPFQQQQGGGLFNGMNNQPYQNQQPYPNQNQMPFQNQNQLPFNNQNQRPFPNQNQNQIPNGLNNNIPQNGLNNNIPQNGNLNGQQLPNGNQFPQHLLPPQQDGNNGFGQNGQGLGGN